MTSLERLENINTSLNQEKLSSILPLLYPIALECKDYEGYIILSCWGRPLCNVKNANTSINEEHIRILLREGLDAKRVTDIINNAYEKWLAMRSIDDDMILAMCAKEMEDHIVALNEMIKAMEPVANMHPTDLYFYVEQTTEAKLKSIANRQQVEKQYTLLKSYIETKIVMYIQTLKKSENPTTQEYPMKEESNMTDFSKVFIVHGHNGELKEAVARVIEKQGIKAIILHEQVNRSDTIIEKFEKHSNVGAAICLFTADDLGKAKDSKDEKPRARQNVVFESGFFMGKLGRDRVILLADHGVEIPSDLQGVVYTDTHNWVLDVLKELKAMGYSIDYNKIDN